MNPNSQYHLAFNLGYPNPYDRAHRRTGESLMVHGKCKSAGCYAMTDALMEEIYALAREAFIGGQDTPRARLPVPHDGREHGAPRQERGYPSGDPEEGYDYFELTRQVPTVAVCNRRYVVNVAWPGGEPPARSRGRVPGVPPPQARALPAQARRADRRAAHRRAGPQDARRGRHRRGTQRSGLTEANRRQSDLAIGLSPWHAVQHELRAGA